MNSIYTLMISILAFMVAAELKHLREDYRGMLIVASIFCLILSMIFRIFGN